MRKRVFFLTTVVGALVAVLFFGARVRQVQCVLNDQVMRENTRICQQLQALRGSHLLWRDFTRDAEVAALLFDQENNQGYDLRTVEKSLGGTLTLFLTDRPPAYRMVVDDARVLISTEGDRRADVPELSVPLVVDAGGVYSREPARTHQFLRDFLAGLGEKQTRVTEVTLESMEKVVVRLTGFPFAVVSLEQDPRRAAARLSLLLDRLDPYEIDSTAREIDLRFDLPVMRSFESTFEDSPESSSESTGTATIDSPE